MVNVLRRATFARSAGTSAATRRGTPVSSDETRRRRHSSGLGSPPLGAVTVTFQEDRVVEMDPLPAVVTKKAPWDPV